MPSCESPLVNHRASCRAPGARISNPILLRRVRGGPIYIRGKDHGRGAIIVEARRGPPPMSRRRGRSRTRAPADHGPATAGTAISMARLRAAVLPSTLLVAALHAAGALPVRLSDSCDDMPSAPRLARQRPGRHGHSRYAMLWAGNFRLKRFCNGNRISQCHYKKGNPDAVTKPLEASQHLARAD
jgi:hypothetical protein